MIELVVDGVTQWQEWFDDAIAELDLEQINWQPGGRALSAGWNAWHVARTCDNVTNFVLRGQKPIWMTKDYFTRMDLPKVEQGTGMDIQRAHEIRINDKALLLEYMREVGVDTLDFIRNFPVDTLQEIQLIKPMGEIPKWRILRQVLMTHGFLHLGEVNAIRGQLGLAGPM